MKKEATSNKKVIWNKTKTILNTRRSASLQTLQTHRVTTLPAASSKTAAPCATTASSKITTLSFNIDFGKTCSSSWKSVTPRISSSLKTLVKTLSRWSGTGWTPLQSSSVSSNLTSSSMTAAPWTTSISWMGQLSSWLKAPTTPVNAAWRFSRRPWHRSLGLITFSNPHKSVICRKSLPYQKPETLVGPMNRAGFVEPRIFNSPQATPL